MSASKFPKCDCLPEDPNNIKEMQSTHQRTINYRLLHKLCSVVSWICNWKMRLVAIGLQTIQSFPQCNSCDKLIAKLWKT